MFSNAVILAIPALLAQVPDTVRPAATPDDPPAIVYLATRAVEGDSAEPWRARWRARRAADPLDRAATLGLATLARLAYDYSAADSLYQSLTAGDATPRDRFAAYAELGLGWGMEDQGWSTEAGTRFAVARKVAHAAGDRRAEAEALVGMAFPRGRVEGLAVGAALLDTAAALIRFFGLGCAAQAPRPATAQIAAANLIPPVRRIRL